MAPIKEWVEYRLKIYERNSQGYYRITYVLDGARHQSSGGRTLRGAEKRVREIKCELDLQAAPSTDSDMTVGELLDHYVNPLHHLGWGVRHAQEQERFVRLHVRPHVNLRRPATQLSKKDFERILSQRMRHTASVDTLQSAIQMCRTLVTHLQEQVGVSDDPMRKLGPTAMRSFRQRLVPDDAGEAGVAGSISVAGELRRLIPSFPMSLAAAAAYADRRDSRDVLTADERELEILIHPYVGLRPGEGRAMTAAQVAADGAEILVDRTFAEATGRRWVKATKNAELRTVAVPPPLRCRLAARRDRAMRVGGPGALMFPSPRGGHWGRSNFARKFAPAKQDAGWMSNQSLRDLRHLYAVTALGDWGLPIEVVSAELGHHSPEFTSRRYLSRRDGYRDAMEESFARVDW